MRNRTGETTLMEQLLRDNLLGAILVSRGLIDEEQLVLALQVQEREGGWRKLGDILQDLGYLSPEGLSEALEVQRCMADEVLSRIESPRSGSAATESSQERLLVYFQDRREISHWSQVLFEEGYALEKVSTAEQALQRLRRQRYALLLIEITIPELLRFPVITRQLDPDLATVAVVDYPIFRRSRRGLFLATPYYLLRPFDREELLLVLQEALKRRRLSLQNRLLHGELEQRSRELILLTELSRRLTATDDLTQALTQAMFQAVDIFGCQAGSLLMVNERTGELRFEVMVGEHVAPLRPLRIKIGEGIAGWVAQTGQPLIVPDVRQDSRFLAAADRLSGFETRSILCVPIWCRGKTVGVIEVINKADGTPFTPWDQRVLMAIAAIVGTAIEWAYLRQTLRKRIQ